MSNLLRFLDLAERLLEVRLSGRRDKEQKIKRVIFETLQGWGGVYIKFLQILAGTNKFMNGWGGPKEMKVFSEVAYEPINLEAVVDLSKFRELSQQPVAAGSFAQVYRGKLMDGKDVAVKVLRPSITRSLERDLRFLRRLGKLFARFLPDALVDYNEAAEACAEMFKKETDYAREMCNQQYFYEFYRDDPAIIIPKVYRELSSAWVIVQDFIDGPTLSSVMSRATAEKPATVLAKELTGSDLVAQVTSLGGKLLYSGMCGEYVFGDAHPGNIVLLANNRVALVDFGVVAGAPSSHKMYHDWVKSYFEILSGRGSYQCLLTTSVACFAPDLATALAQLRIGDEQMLEAVAASLVGKMHTGVNGDRELGRLMANGHLMSVLMNSVDLKVLNMKIDMHNFELLKSMQAYLGAVTILDNSETGAKFASIARGAMSVALAEAERRGVEDDYEPVTRFSLTESYELVVDTLTALANSDEEIFNNLRERMFA